MPDEGVLFQEAYVCAAEGYEIEQGFVVLELYDAAYGSAHFLGEFGGDLKGYWVFAFVGGQRGVGWDVHVVAGSH